MVNRLDGAEMGNGRDGQGRFRPGHPGGPGRPPRAVEAEYLAAVLGEVPLDRWREIVRRAAEDAAAGDKAAREWLSRYLAPPETRARVAVESATSDRAAAVEAALAEYAALLEPGEGGATPWKALLAPGPETDSP